MSFSSERTAIVTWFSSQWNTNDGKVFYENQKLTVPDDIYLVLTILPGDARPASIASQGISKRLFRYSGIVQVDLYAKKESGTIAIKTKADLVHDIFLNKRLNPSADEKIQFQVPYLTSVGDTEERHRMMVTCPFYRDSYLLK